MNDIFREYLDQFVVVYLDDILVYSKTYDEHRKHLHKVLTILRENNLYAKEKKCELFKTSVEYLGHYLSNTGQNKKYRGFIGYPINYKKSGTYRVIFIYRVPDICCVKKKIISGTRYPYDSVTDIILYLNNIRYPICKYYFVK